MLTKKSKGKKERRKAEAECEEASIVAGTGSLTSASEATNVPEPEWFQPAQMFPLAGLQTR